MRRSYPTKEVIDLFSGAGGWAEGLKALGLTHRGIEWDATIASTANAAGHHTIVGDVAELDPRAFGTPTGMVGSPPCQAYSNAGKRLGRVDRPIVEAAVRELAEGRDTRAERLEQCQDPRSLLTAEPMRWAVELRPRWIALEQVPAVLPLWKLYAELLRERDYHADTGVLSAEQFGVPQTRKRAYLIASLDGPVSLPTPTHTAYNARNPVKQAPGFRAWVSMAEALGWGMTERPATTVRARPRPDGRVLEGGSGGRRTLAREQERGAWRYRGTEADGFLVVDRSGARANEGHLSSEPAPTLTSRGRRWYWTRTATTVNSGSQQHGALRLSVEDAAVLQGFPADYPWQGSRSKQFLQIGNAVVPRMAELVAGAAAGPTSLRAAA